ncbi:hypothetical protein ACFWIR_15730, partial [Streptomyces olivaceus]
GWFAQTFTEGIYADAVRAGELRLPSGEGAAAFLDADAVAAYAQLRLARPLAADLRRPWEKPAEPHRLTPARVRRGFSNLHAKTGSPAGAPKPSRPGPGRPPGSRNRSPAIRHDVGRVLATGEAYSRPAHHKKGTKPRRIA